MVRRSVFFLAISGIIHFTLSLGLLPTSSAQEWAVRAKPRGTLKVVDLEQPTVAMMWSYAEGLVNTDKDSNLVACLAKDWRWIDDRTIEFMLRKDVTFHNGEKFNAEAVRVNWEQYRKMESPRAVRLTNLPDETVFEIIDEYTVRFTFPEPDGLAFVKFRWFFQAAPAFFKEHRIPEKYWLYFPEAGPWGTGPFKFVKGTMPFHKPSDQFVLEANEEYWDLRYPLVKRIIFENKLIGSREQATGHCTETEGVVDIVTHIRPLDTLKVAESRFAKVVKSRGDGALLGWINQRKKDSKWKDIRLRKAINYAINRKELRKYAARGNAFNLGGYLPVGAYGHNPNLTLYAYDIAKAKSLLSQAGYPDGFEIKIVVYEAWKLEAQIIAKMLERTGFKVRVDVLTMTKFIRKVYMPLLENPPEEQEWDIAIWGWQDYFAHTGLSFLAFPLIEESDYRWIEYDALYEKTWKDMARTVDREAQEKKIRQLVRYIYNQAYELFIYSPVTLFAVSKAVNLVPHKFGYLRLNETSVTENHWSVRGKNN